MTWIASHLGKHVDAQAELCFWVQPGQGEPYRIDLTEFSIGGRQIDRPAERKMWSGDYDGRPTLAAEFASYHRLERPVKATSGQMCAGMRHLYRAHTILKMDNIQSIVDLQDSHGWVLKNYFGEQFIGKRRYKKIKIIVDKMRNLTGQSKLFWPNPNAELVALKEDVDTLGVQRLYSALKNEGRSIKEMFKDGDRLANAGSDPRILKDRSNVTNHAAGWRYQSNHAWLIRKLTEARLPNNAEIEAAGAANLRNNPNFVNQVFGPEYRSPGMGERGSIGIVGKTRWFHPSFFDTAVFFWLFLLGTGWNLSTALALDVSDDKAWVEDHPHKNEFKVLHSFKGRSNSHVFALSLKKPEWHPYQIVRFMIERTRSLRETLRYRLSEAERNYAQTTDLKFKAEIVRLTEAIRSPWLYHVLDEIGWVGAIQHHHIGPLNDAIRSLVSSAGLDQIHPTLTSFGTSVAHDAWISRAYVATSHTVLLAQLAAQHSDLRSLKHYLQKRRFRNRSEMIIRRIQFAAFEEIAERRPLDPTRLRILVDGGIITPDQESRLRDYRQRTRLGMGCLDPRRPPHEIAPDHPDGKLCRVQRCTGCQYGVIFEDSLEPLTRARAELIRLRRDMPLSAWDGSSVSEELQSIDASLTSFDQEMVERLTESWLRRLAEVGSRTDVTYPSY